MQTHGEGVDHVVDVGGADTLSKSLGSLCKLGGCVHIVGALGGLVSLHNLHSIRRMDSHI